MSEPFKPLDGISRKDKVLHKFADLPENSLVTYQELGNLLGTDERVICQKAVNSSKPSLERLHNKALVSVPNQGYRVVKASEHLMLAKQHQKKSFKQLSKSRSKVDHVNMSSLTDGERAAIMMAATSIGLQLDYMRRNDIRSRRIEDAVKNVRTEQQRSEEEIAELKERLRRLENDD